MAELNDAKTKSLKELEDVKIKANDEILKIQANVKAKNTELENIQKQIEAKKLELEKLKGN